MGIAGVEPRQLALTVGTTGSGSTDSPAPSPTNAKIDITNTIDTTVGIAVPTDIDTNAKVNIDTIIDITIDTVAGIAAPAVIDAHPLEPEVDIMESIIIDTTSPNATDLIPVTTIVGPTSGTTGAVSAITGGFDMAFGLFNFHVGNDGVAELISVGDSTPPATAPSTPPVTEGNPSATTPLAHLEEEPRPKDLTPSVGSNDFKIHLHPQPPPTVPIVTRTTLWALEISRLTRSSAVKILGEALQLSTRQYPSASGLSTPSCSVPRPTTLIMSKGCTQITHA
jgi:hypothetical protein